jgi:hypothetical protein
MEAAVHKEVEAGNAYFTVSWSALTKVDRYQIIRSVPAVAGIFELYYMDDRQGLNLFQLGNAWYGGLRSWIRSATDPSLATQPGQRRILTDFDCYYRYTACNSYRDIVDVLFFLGETYFPKRRGRKHSGRYENILINEITPDKLRWR